MQQESFEKEVVISGCPVKLSFHRTGTHGWTVSGTIQCGVGDNMRREVFETPACQTSEEAESLALRKASGLLGKNVAT